MVAKLLWWAPGWLLGLMVVLTGVGWLVLGSVAVSSDAIDGWKLVVTSGASIALAAAVLVVAVQSFVGHDRGLPAGQLAALGKLAGKGASDRGTDAVKTVYGWRQDQWRQLARGVAGVVVALLVAIVPLLLNQPSTEKVYTIPANLEQVPGSPQVVDGLPLTQMTVTGATASFPPALWVALADLLLLAVLAVVFARGARQSYLRDIAELAEREG